MTNKITAAVINNIVNSAVAAAEHDEIGVIDADGIRVCWEADEDTVEVSITATSRGNGAHAAAWEWVCAHVEAEGGDTWEVHRNVDAWDVTIHR